MTDRAHASEGSRPMHVDQTRHSKRTLHAVLGRQPAVPETHQSPRHTHAHTRACTHMHTHTRTHSHTRSHGTHTHAQYSDDNLLFLKRIGALSGVGPETFMSPGACVFSCPRVRVLRAARVAHAKPETGTASCDACNHHDGRRAKPPTQKSRTQTTTKRPHTQNRTCLNKTRPHTTNTRLSPQR